MSEPRYTDTPSLWWAVDDDVVLIRVKPGMAARVTVDGKEVAGEVELRIPKEEFGQALVGLGVVHMAHIRHIDRQSGRPIEARHVDGTAGPVREESAV